MPTIRETAMATRRLTVRQRAARAWAALRRGRIYEAPSRLAWDDDPDLNLTAQAGGSAYFRRLTQSPRRDLSPVQQARMVELAAYLYATNPLARRGIDRSVAYIIGAGVSVDCADEACQEVVDRLWAENSIDRRLRGWIVAQRLYGEVFLPVVVNPVSGALGVGFLPAADVTDIITESDNIEMTQAVAARPAAGYGDPVYYRMVRRDRDPASQTYGLMIGTADDAEGEPTGDDVAYASAILYASANRLPDAVRGMSDLYAVADYVDAYETVIFDLVERAALLNSLIVQVQHAGLEQDEINAIAAERGGLVPKAGTVIHTNEAETWNVMTPEWANASVETWSDIILGMVATGLGVPKYWLNSTLDPNRASAEQMALPVLKDLEERQREASVLIEDMVAFALDQAVAHGQIQATANRDFEVTFPPLTTADAAAGSTVLAAVANSMVALRAEGVMPDAVTYRVLSAALGLLGVDIEPEALAEAIGEDEAAEAEAEEAAEEEEPEIVVPFAPPGEVTGAEGFTALAEAYRSAARYGRGSGRRGRQRNGR